MFPYPVSGSRLIPLSEVSLGKSGNIIFRTEHPGMTYEKAIQGCSLFFRFLLENFFHFLVCLSGGHTGSIQRQNQQQKNCQTNDEIHMHSSSLCMCIYFICLNAYTTSHHTTFCTHPVLPEFGYKIPYLPRFLSCVLYLLHTPSSCSKSYG